MQFVFVGLLVFSTVLIAALRPWRSVAPALLLWVGALAAVHGASLSPGVGFVKLLFGLAAIGILAWEGLSSVEADGDGVGSPGPVVGASARRLALFGMLTAALLASYGAALNYPVAHSPLVSFAACWQVAVGSVVLVTARGVLRQGLGLVLLTGAGDLLLTDLAWSLDPGLLACGALVQVLVALAAARVSQASRHISTEVEP